MNWRTMAACADMPDFVGPGDVWNKKNVCAQCPVNNECLRFAIEQEDFESTIYGGFTGVERKQLVKDGFV